MAEWKQFKRPGFVLDAPAEPQYRQTPPDEQPWREYFTFRSGDGFLYELRVNHMPPDFDIGPAVAALHFKVKNTAQADFKDDEVYHEASAERPETGDVTGFDVHYVTYEDIPESQGGWSRMLGRGTDCYHCLALFPRAGGNDDEARRFVESFKLTPV